MNVHIITEEDVFYVRYFFINFFPLCKKASFKIKAVTILEPFNKSSKVALAKQMFSFYGSFHFVRVGFLFVIKKMFGFTIRKLAIKNGFKIIDTKNVNSPEFINKVKDLKIDTIVSIAAPQIFKKELISSVPNGCINSHSSLLPENKGMMPVFWGLYKNADNIGVTIHFMDEKLDNGDIIVQQQVPVSNESLHQMILKTKKISAELIHQSLEQMSTDKIKSIPMPSGGSYQTFPTAKEVMEFKKLGKRIF